MAKWRFMSVAKTWGWRATRSEKQNISIFRERNTRDARLNNIMAEICPKTH
jgi:hypothetical protein